MRATAGALLLAAAAGSAAAQELPSTLRAADGETVAFAFPARPGVCGAGDAILIREPDGSTTFLSGRISGRASGRDARRRREEGPPCEAGDVVVEARREGGTLTDVQIRVGGPAPRAAGSLPATLRGQTAADYLLKAAETAAAQDARDLILAAVLAADAVRWPGLLRLAKDRRLPSGTRRAAMHWLAREAAAEPARELGGIVRDRTEEDEVRAAAVFAVSRLPREHAVDLLIEVVRTVPDARVRSRALFWLAEMDHPRAIALFEEILSPG